MCECIWWIYIVANLILLCSLKTYLSFETWKKIARAQGLSYSSLSFFRQASKHPFFKYLRHFCVHFFQPFFSFFLMNNFCIAPCLFSATKLWEIATRTLEQLFDGYPIGHIFLVFTPNVGVKHFLVDLDGMACFFAYPQCRSSAYVGGVYVILILRAWQTSDKASTKLD